MKKPVTCRVRREHGNSGDVILEIAGADGDVQKLGAPGELSPFTAVHTLCPFIEQAINAVVEADPVAEAPPDPKEAETLPPPEAIPDVVVGDEAAPAPKPKRERKAKAPK